MANRIVKKLGGERLGSGGKMMVTAHGYGFSTHNVSKVRRTSMSFGTLVPMGTWMLTTGSRLRIELDALITSNALLYQLYGSAKFQLDVFSARVALYNPKMLLNLNDQGYDIKDIKFPQMELKTRGIIKDGTTTKQEQINKSALLAYLGIRYNGQAEAGVTEDVTREHNAMNLLMYYQTVKEYYCNRQEKIGMMIHNSGVSKTVDSVYLGDTQTGDAEELPNWDDSTLNPGITLNGFSYVLFQGLGTPPRIEDVYVINGFGFPMALTDIWGDVKIQFVASAWNITGELMLVSRIGTIITAWGYAGAPEDIRPRLYEWDLKAVDRMQMAIMKNVDGANALKIDVESEMPYGASFKEDNEVYSIETSQEGLCIGTYQSDVFNNWLDNATINALNNKNKVKVDSNGEWNINDLNITQKLYNYDQRIGVTDGTLEEWREMTYGQVGKTKSLKPVYEGGLSKEIVFDMVVSTAGTDEEPLGSIASRGQFGSKHKGGHVEIETDEEKLVMVIAKITPRIVYNQGNIWETNLKTLEDLHKPALDKIGYQNLVTDTMYGAETIVKTDGTLETFSAGKQPAWQWYRTNYDDALGNMADVEDYKVFGREYGYEIRENRFRIKDLTTYIDPQKFNDVFAIKSLDAMNFDVQVGMDAKLTMVMSEEVIPNL